MSAVSLRGCVLNFSHTKRGTREGGKEVWRIHTLSLEETTGQLALDNSSLSYKRRFGMQTGACPKGGGISITRKMKIPQTYAVSCHTLDSNKSVTSRS
jgi:hypothetical protein